MSTNKTKTAHIDATTNGIGQAKPTAKNPNIGRLKRMRLE